MGKSYSKLGEFTVNMHGRTLMKKLMFNGLTSMGKLSVYSDRLEFAPGAVNIMDQATVIPMDDITSVSVTNVAFVVPNGIQIITRSGREYILIPKAWEKTQIIDLINAQLTRI
jgi:hypothetical protein